MRLCEEQGGHHRLPLLGTVSAVAQITEHFFGPAGKVAGTFSLPGLIISDLTNAELAKNTGVWTSERSFNHRCAACSVSLRKAYAEAQR